MRDRGMEAYYCQRAPEYDSFYSVPERQEELAWLAGWMREHCCGRHVLEIAAGTGHWTRIAAESAATVTATDVSKEMLAIAAARIPAKHVRFVLADAYALPRMDQTFEVGMAHLWWSHVPRQSRMTSSAVELRPSRCFLPYIFWSRSITFSLNAQRDWSGFQRDSDAQLRTSALPNMIHTWEMHELPGFPGDERG